MKCPKCGTYIPDQDGTITSAVDRQKMNDQFLEIEFMRDFINFLFDTELDYLTMDEANEKFKEYQEKEHGGGE